MATQAKIVIKGKNDITSAVKSASNDLSSLKDSVMKLGTIIKSSLVMTGAIKGIQALGSACRTALVDEFGEANRTFKQLALALKDKSAFDAVTENLDNLCKKTLIANGCPLFGIFLQQSGHPLSSNRWFLADAHSLIILLFSHFFIIFERMLDYYENHFFM